MKYILVQQIDHEDGTKQLVRTDLTAEQLFPALQVRGFDYAGLETSESLRPELRFEPKFKGLHGPCWGGLDDAGQPCVRYEDWKAYNTLST